MNKSRSYLFLLMMFSVLGCESIQVAFFIDGQKEPVFESQPAIHKMKKCYLDEIIMITDKSSPKKEITHRQWDLNGDGVWEDEYTNKQHFPWKIKEEGVVQIKLCINQNQYCTSRWINVIDATIDLDLEPAAQLLHPAPRSTKIHNRNIDVAIKLDNVFDDSSLDFRVNTQKVNFNFDEQKQLLTSIAKLNIGVNLIEVKGEDGLLDKSFLF